MGTTKRAHFDKETNQMANILKALGHPARLEIIKFLIAKPQSICNDVVVAIPLAQSTISRHLSELKKVGLISGKNSGATMYYTINDEVWECINNYLVNLFSEHSKPVSRSHNKSVKASIIFRSDLKQYNYRFAHKSS